MKKIQCGGFYVDDEAIETREGKPFLKTGGGSDPAVENAKETGGFGWTESGEQQTLIAPVTAGTQEGYGNVVGEFTMSEIADFYEIMNIVNQALPEHPVSVKINDEVYKVIGAYDDDEDGFVVIQFGVPDTSWGTQYGTLLRYDGQNKFNFNMLSEYIDAGMTTVSVFKAEETVHTIDPKYISGGGMVVHFEVDTSSGSPVLTADKTVSEVKQAMLSMPVSGILTANGRNLVMSLMSNYNEMYLCFAMLSYAGEDAGYESAVIVHEENGEWVRYG